MLAQKKVAETSKSLLDEYPYAMHGKIFKFQDHGTKGDQARGSEQRVEVFISFGGLLMQLIGDPRKLENLEVDKNVYLFLRKAD